MIAIVTIELLKAIDATPCLVAATIPINEIDMTCSTTSKTLRPLYAALQLLQFTT